LLALALIAFTLELEEGGSAPWGGISVALAIGLIAVAAVLQAVDGVALKRRSTFGPPPRPNRSPMYLRLRLRFVRLRLA